MLRSTRNFSESSQSALSCSTFADRLKGKTDCKQLFESRGLEAKVIREFIVAIAFHRFSIFFQPECSRFPLQKECEQKAGHPASCKPCAGRRKRDGYANGGRTRSIDTLRVYSSVLGSLDKHVLLPTLENHHQGKCLPRRSTREQSKLFNLSCRPYTPRRERNFTERN